MTQLILVIPGVDPESGSLKRSPWYFHAQCMPGRTAFASDLLRLRKFCQKSLYRVRLAFDLVDRQFFKYTGTCGKFG